MLVKPQSANPAIIDEIACAVQKETRKAVEGPATKKPYERVMKIGVCEIMATWRYVIMCSWGSSARAGSESSVTPNLSWKKVVCRMIHTRAML